MSNEVNLSTFPSSYAASPENLSEMYWEAYYRIRKVGRTHRDAASAKWYK